MSSCCLSIVVISYANYTEAKETIKSISDFCILPTVEIIIVASSYTKDEEGNLTDFLINLGARYKTIFDVDSGLYNAMNIGQKEACGDYVWFLNSGDLCSPSIIPEKVIEIIQRKYSVHLFYSELDYQKNRWLRPGLGRLTMYEVGHQSVIAPLSNPPLMYDENGSLSADRPWIHKNVEMYGDTKHLTILSIHSIGGITTLPKLSTLIIRLRTQGFKRFLYEFTKLFLFIILGAERYYKIMFRLNKYPTLKFGNKFNDKYGN